jgi:hypothetical protein
MRTKIMKFCGHRTDLVQVARMITFVVLVVTLKVCPFFARGTTTASGRHGSVGKSPALKEDLNLVLVNATVTDRHHRFITGLGAENFRIYEGKVEETISRFTPDDGPASIGVLLDVSGSMSDKLATAKEAACTFLKTLRPNDEVFLLTFASHATLETDFTSKMREIQQRLTLAGARGGLLSTMRWISGLRKWHRLTTRREPSS